MFWTVFSKLCAGRNTSASAVAKELGLSNSAATKWKKGSVPSGAVLKKIADYFGVPVSVLLGGELPDSTESAESDLSISAEKSEEIAELKKELEQKEAEIKRLNRLLDITLQAQEALEKKLIELKESGIDVDFPLK